MRPRSTGLAAGAIPRQTWPGREVEGTGAVFRVTQPFVFPQYSAGERRADAAVHVLGVSASLAAFPVLIVMGALYGPALSTASLAVYGVGLLAVMSFSAGYNLVRRPNWKEILRRLDHAAIFVMIAGTYTPFAVLTIGGAVGTALLAVVWGLAAAGIAVKLLFPRRFDRAAVALYLVQGWAILAVVEALIAGASPTVLILMLVGGGLYTLGVVFHLWRRLPYHNAIWHALVLLAAGCHYAAILIAFALPF